MSDHILDQLYPILVSRKDADPATSYVAKLYGKGTAKVAQKVGEEAVETVIEALRVDQQTPGSREKLLEESADLLFHLSILWAHLGVTPDEVYKVLEGRFGHSGLERCQSSD